MINLDFGFEHSIQLEYFSTKNLKMDSF